MRRRGSCRPGNPRGGECTPGRSDHHGKQGTETGYGCGDPSRQRQFGRTSLQLLSDAACTIAEAESPDRERGSVRENSRRDRYKELIDMDDHSVRIARELSVRPAQVACSNWPA